MKRVIAFSMSLLLLWAQTVVAAQAVAVDAPAKCVCCSCKDATCCVGESEPMPSVPQPAAPSPSGFLTQHLFVPAASPAWLLPSVEAEVFPSTSVSPLFAARVPLFTRDCALLI